MAFLIVCPACLQRLELPDLDSNQVLAANGLLCTCVRCSAQLKRVDQGHVVTTDARPLKIYAIPKTESRALVRRERRGSILFRVRGLFGALLAKRVTVTSEHVEVRIWLRPKIRRSIPIAHVRGVAIIQHVFLNPPGTMWAAHLLSDDLSFGLTGFSRLDDAIDYASAINIAVLAHKPAGDPYRGLVAEA